MRKENWYSKLYYIFISVIIITIIVIAFILYKTREDKQNRSLDYYSNFEELKENTTEGKDWRIKTKNRKDNHILVTAIHGGGIEPGTTELARRGQYR